MKLNNNVIRWFAVSVLLFCCGTNAIAMSATEEQIRDAVIKQNPAQLKMLQKLVNINSGTSNIAGVKKVGEIVRAQLNHMGFKTTWVKEPASMHKAPTLVAERRGTKGKRLLLIGHLDTVFPADGKFQHHTLRANTMKGPGALDDKGGIVVILSALQALHKAHALDDTSIIVVLTGDEEDSGKPTSISRKPLVEAARRSDIALDFESSITLETATIARRGITLWTVETHGNESHSATIFQENVGAGAIFEMARILNTMRADLQGEKYLSFNPGLVLGGTKVDLEAKSSHGSAFGKENVVSKVAVAKGDMRFMTVKQENNIKEKMQKIVDKHLPYTQATIIFQQGIPAMQPTDNNLQLLKQYSAASEDLNLGKITPLDPGVRGAGDISHIADVVPANLAGLGPLGVGSHSVIEAVELNSLPIQTQRAAVFIYRLTR